MAGRLTDAFAGARTAHAGSAHNAVHRCNTRRGAALRLATRAAAVPNAVTDDDFAELRRHFDDAQVVEIVGVIALFGFLNRWNDTLATTLEDAPRAFAEATLAAQGWTAGKHA
jgi:alkylhydroperoxidase family enzyme